MRNLIALGSHNLVEILFFRIDYVMFTIFYTRAPPGGEIFKFVNVCEMLTKMAKNVLAVFSNSGVKNCKLLKSHM